MKNLHKITLSNNNEERLYAAASHFTGGRVYMREDGIICRELYDGTWNAMNHWTDETWEVVIRGWHRKGKPIKLDKISEIHYPASDLVYR